MRRIKMLLAGIHFSVVIAVLTPAQAAVLAAVSVNTDPGSTAVDLTAQGTVDWAVWHVTSAAALTSPVAPTNEKVGGSAIGAASLIGAGGLRGSGVGNWGTKNFTYSDGTNTPTGITNTIQSLIFSNQLDLAGSGVQLSLQGDPSKIYEVNIWATGFNGQGTMTASLNGATDVSLSSQLYLASKAPTLFTFQFQPDNASDVLTLKYVLAVNSIAADNSHVGIQAVTVSVVPEPSMALLGMAAAIGWVGVRRRSLLRKGCSISL